MPCKCNTSKRDLGCTIDHSMSELQAAIAFPNLDREPDQTEEVYDLTAYAALDMLLKATGLLPMNQISTRPVLHKAIDRALGVLDRAVKEGRYVSRG